MDAIAKLVAAQAQAVKILNELLTNEEEVTERARLATMTKKELIEEVIKLKIKGQKATLEECAMQLLEDEACEWLPYTVIAALINKFRAGSETNEKCLAWYASKGRQEGRAIRNRRKL